MLEALLELLGEFALQALLEVLAELGLHSLRSPWRRRPNAWFAALAYLLFGAAAGGLSLLLLPAHLVQGNALRLLNVVVTPLGAGLLMSALGNWRQQQGAPLLRIDRFAYGYLFALALALVRLRFAV